jgi:hypothetical protein
VPPGGGGAAEEPSSVTRGSISAVTALLELTP